MKNEEKTEIVEEKSNNGPRPIRPPRLDTEPKYKVYHREIKTTQNENESEIVEEKSNNGPRPIRPPRIFKTEEELEKHGIINIVGKKKKKHNDKEMER